MSNSTETTPRNGTATFGAGASTEPAAQQPPPKKRKKAKCCRCPACRGLECVERPRFFAGQLLTESDLNSEQSYMLAKNRLHNRYLHGWGVVCGLAVVCSPCAGWVRIKEGYAIDPCGNDVIVCKDRDFNLIEAIHKCIEARKRPADECAPWQDPNADCTDDQEHWCVTISYREIEAKPTMPLRQEKSSCGCGGECDCGGGCGCGGGGAKSSSKTKKASTNGCNSCQPAKPATPSRSPACEPTRILESYCVDVVPQPESCRDVHETRATFATAQPLSTRLPQAAVGGLLGSILPQGLTKSPVFALAANARSEESLLNRIMLVWDDATGFLQEHLSRADYDAVMSMIQAVLNSGAAASSVGTTFNVAELARFDEHASANIAQPDGDLCCRFRKVLQLLYTSNPLGVHCNGFDCPPCQRPQQPAAGDVGGWMFLALGNQPATTNNDVNAAPAPNADVLRCLVYAFIQYVVDAICMLLLPPCPSAPCDDRIILACVTVKDDKIVHICNFDCRHYAGSFNSLNYWLSAFPIVDLIALIVRGFCCTPIVPPAPTRVNP